MSEQADVPLVGRLAAILSGKLPANTDASRAIPPLLARYGSVITVRSGRVFAWQDDAVERCAIVLAGKILPVKNRIGAAPLALPQLGPGDWVCLAEVVAAAPAQADYRAEEETEILAMTPYNFSVLAARAEFSPFLTGSLAAESLALHSWLLGGGPRERIIAWLLSRKRTIAGVANSSVAATQAEIARSLGLSRETVNKYLARLEAEGFLSTGRAEISIPDWDALERSRDED